jgi:hypothetical protein
VPDPPFAINKPSKIEVPQQTRLPSKGGLNAARLC